MIDQTVERRFPIQQHYERDDSGKMGIAPYPTSIPWHVADLAYSVYSNRYGRDQSLERLAERGGFGPLEMNDFLPNWRELAEDVRVAKAVADARRDERERTLGLIDKHEGLSDECWDNLRSAVTDKPPQS